MWYHYAVIIVTNGHSHRGERNIPSLTFDRFSYPSPHDTQTFSFINIDTLLNFYPIVKTLKRDILIKAFIALFKSKILEYQKNCNVFIS